MHKAHIRIETARGHPMYQTQCSSNRLAPCAPAAPVLVGEVLADTQSRLKEPWKGPGPLLFSVALPEVGEAQQPGQRQPGKGGTATMKGKQSPFTSVPSKARSPHPCGPHFSSSHLLFLLSLSSTGRNTPCVCVCVWSCA